MLITLTTDFGVQDGYVGAMKGVMSAIAPGTPFVDITHAIPPQDVRRAAFVLWQSIPYFPQESVHLVVIDPGVGTARLPIAAATDFGLLVGPDNGVFSYLWAVSSPGAVVALENSAYHRKSVSGTFHGRDIFAPVAAYLANGASLESLGPALAFPVKLPLPHFKVEPEFIQGEVLTIDRFGNAITSIGRLSRAVESWHLIPAFSNAPVVELFPERTHVIVSGQDLGPIRYTYGDVAPGSPLALVGSEGLLELALNQGHGASALGLKIGDIVTLRFQT